jgi:CheY-like chemotaxis protein
MSPTEKPSLSILIVEDDFIIAWHLAEMLSAIGHRVCATAATEPAAVAAHTEHRPDLVLMDLRLADKGSGINAARAIREQRPVPIVFCTAHGDDPEFRAFVDGMERAAVVAKPVHERQLTQAIAEAAASAEGARAI